jgi:hypothetical protein
MREQFLRHYDFVEINIQSLKAYIEWLLTEAKLYNAQKKETALRQARIILAVALQLDGKFLQRKKPSPFGRLYYQGISVQSVNKDLRRAMLGHCWCYDIRSSVIAWKMGFARCYRAEVEPNANFRKLFSSTLVYLEDKNDFMVEVRRYTFNSDSNCETELQKKIIKRALTAISFGARASAKGWLDSDGQVRNPALVDIIKNKDERARFLNCDAIRSFIHEQKTLDDYIYKLVQKERPDLLKLDCLKTQSGRPSKAKVLAYLYQHSETQVMAIVTRLAEEHKKKVLAQIHDAVIVRPRFGLDLKCEILEQMQQETDNPYWRLALEELFPFKRRSRDEERELLAHRQRIREAEARAKLYAQGLLSLEQAIKL